MSGQASSSELKVTKTGVEECWSKASCRFHPVPPLPLGKRLSVESGLSEDLHLSTSRVLEGEPEDPLLRQKG